MAITPTLGVIATRTTATVPAVTSAVTVARTSTPRPTPTTTQSPAPKTLPHAPEVEGDAAIIVEQGTSGRREIGLTFDAGGGRGDAERILDILADYGVVGSFSITGLWAQENPDLVRRMVDEGHMVFSHGWSHDSWTGQSTSNDPSDPTTWMPMPQAARLDELERTENVVRDLTGYALAPYFRPPYADYDASVLEDLATSGYTVMVMWSCESLAWMGMTADQIVERCTTDMVPGDIILLHVTDEAIDSDALPGLLDGLAAQGYQFVTVEQLLQP